MIKKIENDLGIKINYSISNKIDEIKYMVPNITKARKYLNYKPSNSDLKKIISSLNDWYKKK